MDYKKLVTSSKIFLDDSTLLCTDLDVLLNSLIPELRAENKKIYIPIRAFYNLKQQGSAYAERVSDIETLYNRGLVEFIGELSDVDADENLYPRMITRLLEKYSITFFTRDESLATRISNRAKESSRLTLLTFDHGRVKNIPVRAPIETVAELARRDRARSKPLPRPEECFEILDTVTSLKDKTLEVSHLPGEGETVYAGNAPVKLTKKLSAGGEGIIYETDTEDVAKVYKKEKLTLRRVEKLKVMVSKKISFPGICYPKALIKNGDGECVGYTMPRAQGIELQRSVFVRKLLTKRFPDWNRRDIIELCITILEKIEYLSQHGIIIGDINPMNILVVSPREVYFVDTDSYQIEDFPCPVGTVNFTAPEIQGVSFSEFLRTPEHENFAITTLLFMLLLPGKAPYAKRGGESPQQNIISEDFSYPYKTNYNGKIPKGPWGLIWSHLPDTFQEAFYCSFRTGEKYTRERLTPSTWLTLFREYRALLEDPGWLARDEEALEIFPTHYRKDDPSHPRLQKKKPKPKKIVPTCKECGKEFEKSELKDGLCKACRKKKSEERLREFKTQVKKPYRRPAPSPDVKTLICRKCRKSFPDYEMKGGLCPSCRAQNPDMVVKSGFEKRQEEKEIYCRNCRKVYPAKDMQGGLCPECRRKLGIRDHQTPRATLSAEKRNQGFNRPREEKTLICRKCRRSFPDTQMKGGLCPECRKREVAYDNYNPARDRMYRCLKCGKSYPVDELTGGVCSACRNKELRKKPHTATRVERASEKREQRKYSKEAQEAIKDFFKDVPASEINDFVSWLLK